MQPRAARRAWDATTRRRAARILAFVRERGEVHPRDVDARSRILIDEQYLPDLFRALNAVLEFLAPKGQAKEYTVDEKRRTHSHAYEPWTDEEDQRLRVESAQGLSIDQLAQAHGRTAMAIRARLERLGLTRIGQ